jgi:hypothetical protein
LVALPNVGCHHHGGASLADWNLPQTKTGEHCKHIQVKSLRENFERIHASASLLSVEEHIALLQALLMETVKQFGGGMSHALLKEMKENRRQYKQEMRRRDPDPMILRELDQELACMNDRGGIEQFPGDAGLRTADRSLSPTHSRPR